MKTELKLQLNKLFRTWNKPYSVTETRKLASDTSDVYILHCSDESIKYLKFPKYSNSSIITADLLNLLKNRGIQYPTVVGVPLRIKKHKYSGYIETEIHGIPLQLEKLGKIDELTDQLLKLHSIRGETFGKIIDCNRLKGEDKSMADYFYKEVLYKVESHFLSTKLGHNCIEHIVQLKKFIDTLYEEIKPSLVHGDLSINHILMYKRNFAGFIDFGDAVLCDPLIDLAHLKLCSFPVYQKVEQQYRIQQITNNFDERMRLMELMVSIKIAFYNSIDNKNISNVKGMVNLIKQNVDELLKLS